MKISHKKLKIQKSLFFICYFIVLVNFNIIKGDFYFSRNDFNIILIKVEFYFKVYFNNHISLICFLEPRDDFL